MAITLTAADAILKHNFGEIIQTVPAILYLGLSFSDPTNNGDGVTEPAAGNYARVSISNSNNATWSSPNPGVRQNAIPFTFPTSTADWTAGASLTYVFLADTPTGISTSVLYYANLTPVRYVPIDTTVYFPANSITITLT